MGLDGPQRKPARYGELKINTDVVNENKIST
jgi:hypothetical protein